MSHIKEVHAREILDSRGNPTIEVDMLVNNFISRASVPSGASTGKYEAVELRDQNKKRYLGKGVLKAVKNINKYLAPRLKGFDCTKQEELDQKLILLDGTRDKHDLGANALLGVSMAACRAAAHTSRKPLFRYISHLYHSRRVRSPRLFFNIINGGKHAGNDLAIQECMISPKTTDARESVRIASEIYHGLKGFITMRYGKNATNIGDEGGFAPPLKNVGEALELLMAAIRQMGYQKKVHIAMDCAASEFYHDGKYAIEKEKSLTPSELIDYYKDLVSSYPIISIEDPFDQDDFEHFSEFTYRFRNRIYVVADDLTVTNPNRIRLAARHSAANCLLLKVNQIGTITEALESAHLAHQNGWRIMVSHRSGETTDDFISDLAVGIGAEFMKSGAPARGERVAKYNQLIRIQEMLE